MIRRRDGSCGFSRYESSDKGAAAAFGRDACWLRTHAHPHSIKLIVRPVQHARDDGRVQYPLLLLYFSPSSCNAKSKMLYSSATPFIAQTLEIAKVHELQDLEDMTLEKLQEMHASSVTR